MKNEKKKKKKKAPVEKMHPFIRVHQIPEEESVGLGLMALAVEADIRKQSWTMLTGQDLF